MIIQRINGKHEYRHSGYRSFCGRYWNAGSCLNKHELEETAFKECRSIFLIGGKSKENFTFLGVQSRNKTFPAERAAKWKIVYV